MLVLTTNSKLENSEIIEALEELCLRYRLEQDPSVNQARLEDEYLNAEGTEEILKALAGLSKYKSDWEKFQTDTCYLDENGEPC